VDPHACVQAAWLRMQALACLCSRREKQKVYQAEVSQNWQARGLVHFCISVPCLHAMPVLLMAPPTKGHIPLAPDVTELRRELLLVLVLVLALALLLVSGDGGTRRPGVAQRRRAPAQKKARRGRVTLPGYTMGCC